MQILFIKQTRHDDRGRNCVEDAENPNPNHEALQFIRSCTVVFHDGANSEEAHETNDEEAGPDHQMYQQRGQDESTQRVYVPQPHEADSSHDIT